MKALDWPIVDQHSPFCLPVLTRIPNSKNSSRPAQVSSLTEVLSSLQRGLTKGGLRKAGPSALAWDSDGNFPGGGFTIQI